ncbi:MAG TPA: hypothetical protein VFZ16_01830 [Hyphomicrobiaceae bacterium]|nr:hypothetical protein [Hyphomicrobiaceae bacterium]
MTEAEFRDAIRKSSEGKKPLTKEVKEHLLGIAKEYANGELLYDEKHEKFCLVKYAPKHLVKRARREGSLLIV